MGVLVFFVSQSGCCGSDSMSGGASVGAQRAVSAAAKGKRRSFRSVQEAREKLTYKSGAKPEFEYELLLMFVRNELSAAVTTPLLAVIVAMGAMFWAPPRELLLWLCTVFVSKGATERNHGTKVCGKTRLMNALEDNRRFCTKAR